jgi:hypothetical protein
MKATRVVGLVAATAVLASAAPAFGAPSIPSIIKRLDKREARHYKETDRRLKAAALLALRPDTARTSRVAMPMTQSASSPTIFTGQALCPAGTTLTGGGVDWGMSPTYPAYHVIGSAPDPGSVAWRASVSTGGAPAVVPSVYAVCLKLS